MNRRSMLTASVGSLLLPLSQPAHSADKLPVLTDHDILDLRIPSPQAPSQRTTVLVPKHVPAGTKLPVLVLMHGLGETNNERAGAYAWIERYGLATSYSRLLRPPIAATSPQPHLTEARADEINTQLKTRPFGGLILACPFTPNVYNWPNHASPKGALDQISRWIVDGLLPEVRAKTPALDGPSSTGIDGCSLGGYVAFEVFLRCPDAFRTCGAVQGAISKSSVERYAKRFLEAIKNDDTKRVHLETSSWDPYREALVALGKAFTRLGVPHDVRLAPGSHNQPWLRDVGTLEMLLWHDATLQRAPSPAPAQKDKDMCRPSP